MAKKKQSPKKTTKSSLMSGAGMSGGGIQYSSSDSTRVRSRREASQIQTTYRYPKGTKIDAAGYANKLPIPVSERQVGSKKKNKVINFKSGLSGTGY